MASLGPGGTVRSWGAERREPTSKHLAMWSKLGPLRTYAVAKIGRETLSFTAEFCDRNSLSISAAADLSRKSGFSRQNILSNAVGNSCDQSKPLRPYRPDVPPHGKEEVTRSLGNRPLPAGRQHLLYNKPPHPPD